MPELPEVETVRRGLLPRLLGRRLVSVVAHRPDLRIPIPPDLSRRLTGRTVTAIERRAKYLLVHMDDGQVLIVHLGMSGRLYIATPGENAEPPHIHIRLRTEDGTEIRFQDPRRFGLVALTRADLLASHPMLVGIGPEPLDAGFDRPCLEAALAGRRTPLKAALLDQRTVAGLGNIYVCEALWRARLSPLREAATVRGTRAGRLVEAIRAVLGDAIEAGGSSLRDYVQADGELGYFQHRFAVYDREGQPCPDCTCRGVVRRIVQSNRSTFYCPARQR